MSQLRQQIGDHIRAHRLRQEITQEALAYQSGISCSVLGRIERGQDNYTIDTLASILDCLGLSLAVVTGDATIQAE